jgi:hypothetical protein
MKNVFIAITMMVFCLTANAQVTLNTVGSSFGCTSTGVSLQAGGGTFYWLYNQDPLPGVYPIDSNSTGDFTVYQTANYMVLATQIGLPIGLSNPATSVTIETPPTVVATANYFPFFLNDTLENKSVDICGGNTALYWDPSFSANENVTDITAVWSNGSASLTSGEVGIGTYSCTISTNNGCSYKMEPIIVNSVPLDIPGVKKKGTESAPILKAVVSGYIADWYQWYKGNTQISGATDVTYLPITSGKYSVEVGAGPCTAKSKNKKITLPAEKLQEPAIKNVPEISVYPNPSMDWITITRVTNDVQMFDLTGRVVALSSGGKIYVGNLPNGIYLILKQKVVVQH